LEDTFVIDFIKKLFDKTKPPKEPIDVKTAPLSEEQIESVARPDVTIEPPQLLVGVGQSIGKQRDHNEDTLFTLNALLSGSAEGIPFGIFIMADGMGGYQHGEVASGLATRALSSYIMSKMYTPFFGLRPEGQPDPLLEIMQQGVKEAQQAVVKSVPGSGTTLTAAFILGNQVTVAHVGDSRAYFVFPDGRMQAITRDHSLVRRLIELGQITEKEAMVHPQRNVLYRALGQSEPFEPDVSTFPLPRPGYLMLCSDGLWGVVPEIEIFNIITKSANPSVACRDLIKAANDAGGPDNISVILVYYPN
jgi:protein phosphatase